MRRIGDFAPAAGAAAVFARGLGRFGSLLVIAAGFGALDGGGVGCLLGLGIGRSAQAWLRASGAALAAGFTASAVFDLRAVRQRFGRALGAVFVFRSRGQVATFFAVRPFRGLFFTGSASAPWAAGAAGAVLGCLWRGFEVSFPCGAASGRARRRLLPRDLVARMQPCAPSASIRLERHLGCCGSIQPSGAATFARATSAWGQGPWFAGLFRALLALVLDWRLSAAVLRCSPCRRALGIRFVGFAAMLAVDASCPVARLDAGALGDAGCGRASRTYPAERFQLKSACHGVRARAYRSAARSSQNRRAARNTASPISSPLKFVKENPVPSPVNWL